MLRRHRVLQSGDDEVAKAGLYFLRTDSLSPSMRKLLFRVLSDHKNEHFILFGKCWMII